MYEQFGGPLPGWLTQHWLFAGATAAELTPLVPVTRPLRFLPGEVIFREGDPATGLYVLSLGTVRIAAVAESGETILAHLSAP